MEPPASGDATTLKNAHGVGLPGDARRRPGPLRARPVRGLPRDRRRRGRLDDRDLRRAAPGHRQLALVGRPVLHPHGQAPADHADRAAARLQAPAPARLRPRGPSTGPEPDQLVVKLDPSTGIRLLVDAQRADAVEARADQPRHGVRRGGRRGRDALRGAAARGDDRRQQALQAPGQRRGDLAGDAAAARRAPAGASLREGIVGPGGGRRARRRRTAAGTDRGWRHEHGEDRRPRQPATPSRQPPPRRRAPRRRRRSRRSPTTRSCPTATPARWSRPTGRSTGSACRASTRRASSARCSTARPAPSGWGRSGSTSRRPGSTSPGRTPSLTTWNTPTGWILVRDALTMGPRRSRGRGHAAHPAAGRRRRRPHAGAHRPVPGGQRRGRAGVRAGLRLRAHAGGVVAGRRQPSHGRRDAAPARRSGCRPTWRSASRANGSGHATPSSRASRSTARSPGPRTSPSPQNIDEANARLAATTRYWRDWLHRARPIDHRWRAADRALGAGDQGPDLHADRRDGRGAHHVAARDAGRGAQLGLPLHLDPRLDLHAAGAALPQPGLGGRRVHAVRRRPRAQRGRRAADHVRDRRAPRPDRVHARRALRVRRSPPGADRQRRLRPAPERRLRRGARLDPAAHAAQPAPAAAAVADRPGAGGVRDAGVAQSRPGHLGGPRRAAALRVLEADVLGRARPRGEARRHPRRPGAPEDLAAPPPTRSRRTSSSTACATACCASTTTPTRSTRPPCWRRSSASCPATTSACARASRRSPTT